MVIDTSLEGKVQMAINKVAFMSMWGKRTRRGTIVEGWRGRDLRISPRSTNKLPLSAETFQLIRSRSNQYRSNRLDLNACILELASTPSSFKMSDFGGDDDGGDGYGTCV